MPNTLEEPLFKTFEHEGWQSCVDAYDASFTPLTSQAGRHLVRQLGIVAGQRVLDSACGPGHLTAEIAHVGASVLGTDFSPNMVARARTHHPDIAFEVQDAEALSLPAGSFDAVTMNFGILHLAAPQRAVAESARVLRSGGVFGFTVWTPPSEALGFALVLQAIEQHGDPDVTLPAGPPFFKYSDPKVAQALMTEAHLSDLHCEKIALCWQLSSPAEFFSAFYRGTARTGGLLRAQPAERLERIEQEVERAALQRFGTGDGFRLEVPMPAMIYSARK